MALSPSIPARSFDCCRGIADRVIAERVIADRVIADRVIADRFIADRVIADRVIAERATTRGVSDMQTLRHANGPDQLAM